MYRHAIMKNITNITGRLGNQMFQTAYIYAQMKEGKIPDIYVQDTKFFEKYEKEIKELFGEGIGFLNFVSIHVRRGSNPLLPSEPKYSENPFYVNLCETDYYEKAIALFPNDKFLVFSDEPEWCKEKWGKDKRFQIMEKVDEVEDFNLMSSCKSHIIANSSYSFWAAYLSPTPTKIVIAPSKERWYTDGIERTICPNSWMRL